MIYPTRITVSMWTLDKWSTTTLSFFHNFLMDYSEPSSQKCHAWLFYGRCEKQISTHHGNVPCDFIYIRLLWLRDSLRIIQIAALKIRLNVRSQDSLSIRYSPWFTPGKVTLVQIMQSICYNLQPLLASVISVQNGLYNSYNSNLRCPAKPKGSICLLVK